MKYHVYIKIGPVLYDICSEEPCKVREEYRQFVFHPMDAGGEDDEASSCCRRVCCEVRIVDRFSNIEGDLIYENPERMVFVSGEREYRLYAGVRGVCGIYREMKGKEDQVEIELLRDEISEFEINLIFLEMLAMERFLLKENALVLHSSYIIWKGEGIVFTAPSGTGKSTQAELWRRYAGSEIINGDRSILWWNPAEKRFEVLRDTILRLFTDQSQLFGSAAGSGIFGAGGGKSRAALLPAGVHQKNVCRDEYQSVESEGGAEESGINRKYFQAG